ncbi:MAG: leucine-rich repeat domain-containing protein, partial [Lachnospiraceae bacterium]|nr:leucine-rich repeat domain-containing protein [Lachnospiraceae bacterium]
MKRRYVMWCLAALALVLLIAGRTRAEAATGSGSCGENLSWELNASGVLTIRGNGAMDKSYYSANPAPWADYTDSIKKVVLEEGVTTVAICGFENLPNLSEVSLPDSLTEIGNAAFQNCPSLAQITIPENVTTMGSNIVTGCTGLRNVYFNAKNLTSGELGRPCDEEAVLTITIGEQVRVIPAWFCRIMKALKKVVIPENGDLTDIGDLAFYECTGLTEINLPANLVNIGYQAFYLCAGLSEIELGDQMTSIGQSCFEGCKGLTEVTIPKNMTKIGAYAFKDCTGIVKLTVEARKLDGCGAYVFCAAGSPSHRMNVVFTDDVTMIPGNFLSARDEGDEVVPFVDTVSLGKNITSIGGSAFYHQKYMTCSGLPGALTSIGSYAFGECNKAFTDIVIPEGVTKIERNTFYCCMSAESVTLPQSLKQIGEKAFCGCTSLKKLEIPAGVTSLGRAFAQNCRSMEELIIRSEKYTLDWNGLYGCSSLK